MKIELETEDLNRIIKALEHYGAYLHAVQRDEHAYQRLADKLKVAKQ